MPDDEWADPVAQMGLTFSKEGLRQACFERELSMQGSKRDLSARLHGAGYTITDLMQRKIRV